MRTLLLALLNVAFVLNASAEILVYKARQTGAEFEKEPAHWQKEREKLKLFVLVDTADPGIVTIIEDHDFGSFVYDQNAGTQEVTLGNGKTFVLMSFFDEDVYDDGTSADAWMVTGKTVEKSAKTIGGSPEARLFYAKRLSGKRVRIEDGIRYKMLNLNARLNKRWTKQANKSGWSREETADEILAK